MKNDIFNGYVKKDYIGYVKFSLVLATVLFFACAVFFLLVAIFYNNMAGNVRVMLFIYSGFSFLASLLYPAISIYAIRNYPRCKTLAKSMIKPFVFKD